MAKQFVTFEKKHRPHIKVTPVEEMTRVKEFPPEMTSNGKHTLLICPHCKPSHPLFPNQPSPCGTVLKVTASQTVYTQRYVTENKLTCAKCGEGGGEMVLYGNRYIHLPDCKPEVYLLAGTPPLSKKAAFIFKLKPDWLRTWFEKRTGVARQLNKLDEHGQPTGEILGYFFLKEA